MNDHLLQGGEVFEILDHTTATDWERFVANVEEVLTEWKLNKQSEGSRSFTELAADSISSGLWHERHEELRFGNVKFDLRLQYLNLSAEQEAIRKKDHSSSSSLESTQYEFKDASDNPELVGEVPREKEKDHGEHDLPDRLPECLNDLLAPSQDFASKAHCLVRWYNLRKFILLSPKGDTIVSEDRVKLILSSACIALANVDCHVPIFVQIHNPKSSFFQGISEHYNIRTTYEMVLIRQNLNKYRYLSELMSIFREKISCNLNDPLSVTIRLNYCLDSFQFLETYQGSISEANKELKSRDTGSLPQKATRQSLMAGATFEQVVEEMQNQVPHRHQIIRFVHVAALWPPISDKIVTDSQVHSDLDPAEAPVWTMRCVAQDTCPMKLAHETQAIHQLFCYAIDTAYDTMDAELNFTGCDRVSLKTECLRLSYELATKPEVTLSKQSSDPIRKLVSLLFFKSAELRRDVDALDQIASHLKKAPSLGEVYRNFMRDNKPSVKEFILRTNISRPFAPISTPALPQRMFATLCDQEFRLCGAFSELTN